MDTLLQPRVGVGAFILDDNKRILLLLRNRAPERGHWSIAGGKVDFMETLENAVIREVKEELGADVVVRDLLCVINHILPAENQHWVAPCFLVRVVGGVVENQEPEATQAIGWFALDALPDKLTLTAQTALAAFRKLTSGGGN